jgi:hypothetical protein
MLGQKVDIFIMAGKRKQLSNDIKDVIVEMLKSGHRLQEIADTLNIPRGTVLFPRMKYNSVIYCDIRYA